MPKRVAILLHDLRGGGAERVMLRLAKNFVAKGVVVDIVLVQAKGEYLADVPAGATVINLDRPSVLGAIPAIRRYIRTAKPDAMLSALTHVNVAAILGRALSGSRTRLVISERNQISIKASAGRDFRSALVYKLVRYLYPWADLIACVSNGVRRDLIEFSGISPAKVETIYNPVPEAFPPSGPLQFPHPWLASSVPTVLAIGRLHRQKGFDVLIEALSKLQGVTPCRLLILGEGPERDALQRQIDALCLTDLVQLLGFSDNTPAFLRTCSLFVLSSRWEGLPNVLLEAMTYGSKVVATDCPSGPDEILTGQMRGNLVPVNDPDTLADAMAKTLREPLPDYTTQLEYFQERQVVEKYTNALKL